MKVKLVKEVDGLNIGQLYKVVGVKRVDNSFSYKIIYSNNNKLSTMWVSKELFTYPVDKLNLKR